MAMILFHENPGRCVRPWPWPERALDRCESTGILNPQSFGMDESQDISTGSSERYPLKCCDGTTGSDAGRSGFLILNVFF